MNFSSLRSKSPLILLVMGLSIAAPSAFSQTLNILASAANPTGGQGQLILPGTLTPQPLTVQLLSATGQPIPGAPITFTSFDSLGGYVPAYATMVTTDSNGIASSSYVGPFLVTGQSVAYDTGTVAASYVGIATATFFITTTNVTNSGGALVGTNYSGITNGQSFVGQAGSVSSTPIQVLVQSQANFGLSSNLVPNVAVYLVISSGSTGSISCQEGPYVLTNASGVATCTPVFGSVGTGTFTVTVGGATNSNIPIPFQVTVGPPALIQITGGNNQNGIPGKVLPLPIVATVTDLGGNPVSGVTMNFTASPANGATFTSLRQVTDASGKVSASVVLGSVPGNIMITVVDAGGLIKNPAVFTETVNVTLTGIMKNSGDQQSAFTNAAFASPLSVTVSSSQGALAGTPVTFAVAAGSATLGNANATTDSNGQASTTVTAGGTPGPVVITATAGGFSTSFNLTVIPPGPSSLSFTNGASGVVNSMSPGSIVTIYGNGLANNLQGVTSAFEIGPLPIQLAGVTVQVGSAYAPMIDIGNVSGSQFVSIEVPRETPPGSTSVTITLPGGGASTVPVTIQQASPGLFTYAVGGLQYLVAIKSNGTVASPTNPATRGEIVTIYMTGVPLSPGIGTNAFPAPGSTANPAYPIILGVANQGTPFISAAYSPDLAGVETLTFTVPTSASPGAATVAIGIQASSGTVYSQGATLNIQ